MKSNPKHNRVRNVLHDHPLLRKGGVHQKTNKAKRRNEKQKLKQDWGALIAFV
jgi:hypothetical protein